MLWSIVGATIAVGIPVFILSWYVFQRLFARGALDVTTTGKDFDKSVSKLGKSMKDDVTIESQWFKFGGGFYGIGAVWTLIIVEAKDIAGFIFNFPSLDVLLEGGILGLIIDFFVNQFQNFITAILWFTYWGDGTMIIVYLGIAYFAYYAGVQLASSMSMEELKAWIADMVEEKE